MNRVSAPNLAAADGLSNQSAARVMMSMGQERYAQEVADAQRTRAWVAEKFNPNMNAKTARELGVKEREAADRTRLDQQRIDQGSRQFDASHGLAVRQFGETAATGAVDRRLKGADASGKEQITDIRRAAFDPNGTPVTRRLGQDAMMTMRRRTMPRCAPAAARTWTGGEAIRRLSRRSRASPCRP